MTAAGSFLPCLRYGIAKEAKLRSLGFGGDRHEAESVGTVVAVSDREKYGAQPRQRASQLNLDFAFPGLQLTITAEVREYKDKSVAQIMPQAELKLDKSPALVIETTRSYLSRGARTMV